MKTYISALLNEKGISSEANLLENEGHIGLTIKMLVDFIYSNNKEVVKQVEHTFRMIDFKNGDTMHYVNFLAKGMVQSLGY